MSFWHTPPSYGREMKNYRASDRNKIDLILLPEKFPRALEEGLHLLFHLLEIIFQFLQDVRISKIFRIFKKILEARQCWPLDRFPFEFLKFLKFRILIDECIEIFLVIEIFFYFLLLPVYILVEMDFSFEHIRKS